MIRKLILLFLVCISYQITGKAQALDSVTISLAPYTDTTCPGTQLRFTARPANDTVHTTYEWYTNGMQTGIVIDTFYSTALNTGDMVYCEIYYDSLGYSDSAKSNVITVYHSTSIPPEAIISLTTGNNPDCGGHPLTFTAYAVNGGSAPVYQWRINDTAVTGADSMTFTGIFAGGDSISCMIVSNSTCAPYDTAYSNEIPVLHYNLTAGVSISVTRNPICAGSTDTLTAILTNEGSGYSVTWYIDSTSVARAIGTSYVTDSLHNGDLVYCLLTAPDSCIINHTVLSNVITITVDTNSASNVSVVITKGSNPGCLDSPLVFTATYANFGTMPSTTWYINGVATDQNTPTLDTTFHNGDVVTFQVRETDNGCYVYDTLTTPGILLVRDSTPVAPWISLDGNLLHSNIGTGTYSWYDSSSGLIPGAIDPSYHPSTLGYYWAVRDSANCPSLPSNVIYISLLGVSVINNAANIEIYPNPTSGTLNLDFGKTAVNMTLDIYNIAGQDLMQQHISNQTHHALDISSLPEGNYIIVLKDAGGITSTFKVSLGR